MRVLTALLLLPLLAVPAHAQTAAASPGAPVAAAAAPAPAARSGRHEHLAGHRERQYVSWKQRFAMANTTHDGHLTLAEAKDGYRAVARHFHQIDTAQKGYVTLADIAAWHKAERDKRHERRAQGKQTAHRHRRTGQGMGLSNAADATSAPGAAPGQTGADHAAPPAARNGT